MSSISINFPAQSLVQQRAHVGRVYGFSCDVRHEDRTLRVDLPRSSGGGATGPHPGQLLRASLGACLVMGCTLWARRLGVALDEVQLEIACSYDERGQLGLDDAVPVGWQRLELDLSITSAAPQSEVERVVETARRLSPMLQNLSPAIEQVFRLHLLQPSLIAETKGPLP
jgi:uncharacterized OsmC-like protein